MKIFLLVVVLTNCTPAPKAHAVQGFESQGFGGVWDDSARCAQAVQAGRRLNKDTGKLRVATWNIKWFPDGKPGKEAPPTGGTDLAWLSCIIAYLDVDIYALQEIKLTPRGKEAQTEVAQLLAKITGATWAWENDSCADPYRQHVAFLYRTDRIQISHPHTDPDVDPTQSRAKDKDPMCPGDLRSALGVYVKSKTGGADFHLVNVHLDSGEKSRDFGHRQEAWQRLSKARAKRQEMVGDSDVVFLGDFNSMGCKSCGVAGAAAERVLLDKTMASLLPPFTLAEAPLTCSQYYRNKGTLLDHIVYSRDMREAYGAPQRVAGLCGAARCEPIETAQTPLFTNVSDHCPVYLDITDRDDD